MLAGLSIEVQMHAAITRRAVAGLPLSQDARTHHAMIAGNQQSRINSLTICACATAPVNGLRRLGWLGLCRIILDS
jgi:hypothetical protein